MTNPLAFADLETRIGHPALAGFHDPLRTWFASSFAAPTRAQELAWPAILAGESALVLAPTGSGKTLAAFLTAIDRLMFSPAPEKDARCRVLYVSPLKALAVDVERNLRAPLVGVSRYAERMGHPFYAPEVAIRTGDTPPRERAQFVRNPADILITTPESLFLLLTSNAREALRSVRTVIIDEIHTMVSTKRGAHLSLSLERLEELTGTPLQRIGLSATVRPIDEAARFLGGFRVQGSGFAVQDLDGDQQSAISDQQADDTLGDARYKTEDESHAIRNTQYAEAPSVLGPSSSVDSEERRQVSNSPSPRNVTVIDATQPKRLDLRVEVAVEDMARVGEVIELPSGPASQGEKRTSIWPAIHPLILDLVRTHRSTLIFVNSRRLAERMAAALNELAGEEIVRTHHGSIAREQRLQIEDDLKAGRLPALVATSSLELGIDMGAIDLVVQVESPPSVASAIQRIGRAGHQIDTPSKGIILPKFRGDLLSCAALTERMLAGAVEPMRYPRNPLDVLAQHIVAMVALDEWTVDSVEALVRRAAPFAELTRPLLEAVLDMLSGRYPSDDFAELRPRVTWDRLEGTLRPREGARRVAVTNGGTIPDRGLFGVYLAGDEGTTRRSSARVGELDEEMVFESYVGDTFVLGASSWRIEEITHDRVLVTPAPGQPGKMPFWHGDRAGRPLEFGRAIGALCRTLRELPRGEAVRLLVEKHALTEGAATNLVQYLDDQVAAAGAMPDDRTLVIERYVDEMGDWRVCILSPFGTRVHAPWAMAIGAMLRERTDLETDILWTDDGIVVRLPETDEPPPADAFLPDPDEVEDLVIRQLGVGGGGAREAGGGAPVNALFASRFREAAARALLLPRKHPGQRAPLWQQRKRAADLLHVTAQFGSFPIVLETYREILRDVFDIPSLLELLRAIRKRELRVVLVNSRSPSPFAASLLFNYIANFMYEGDAPLAERRAQALLVDQSQLRELLGEAELRELLDPDALAELELQLQHLTEERKARSTDHLHDLLLRLGDLSVVEIEARCAGSSVDDPAEDQPLSERGPTTDHRRAADLEDAAAPPDAGETPRQIGAPSSVVGRTGSPATDWLQQLERERRILPIPVGGEVRYIAVEDAGRYRDALGIPPPPGLPDAFLEFVRDPLGDVVARYARTHGPFRAEDVARRFGIGVGPVLSSLAPMEVAGRVIQGEFRPGGVGREWCETGVLRALRQKSLARLRREVEPVEQAALGRFYLAWQGIGKRRKGPEALLEVIEQLQGAAIPASVLESQVLPARLEKYDARDLDELTASGAVLWVGREPLGERDGRLSLYLTEHVPLLLPTGGDRPSGPLHEAIRSALGQRGALFFAHLMQACGGALQGEVIDALWDLVWAGEVTNDTPQPLRAYLHPRRKPTRLSGYGGRGFRTRALYPPETAGRWSLVSSFVFRQPSTTERLAALSRQLLDRCGLLVREAVHSEGIEGGFSAIYPVLRRMEEAGHIRRGYFVTGCGAAQFALPGAVDRLRSLRESSPEGERAFVLPATDPANPYGTALPWPERPEGRRPSRSAGATVILVDGALAGWMGRGERHLLTFFDPLGEEGRETARELAHALAGTVGPVGRRALFVKEVDGQPAQDTPMAAALQEAGFTFGLHGYMKRL